MFFAQTDYWNKEDEVDILSYCKRTGKKTWESVNGYLPNCPLVPVQPHGALMDRDDFFAVCPELVDGYKTITDELVVIPAEEGEA